MESNLKIPHMEGIKPAHDISGISVHALRVMVANGDIVSIRIGKKILVNMDSLAEFLRTGKPQGIAKAAPKTETASRIAPISLR